VDPTDPKNAVIVDIELAKDPDGKVRYSFDFYILKPIDLSKGAHKVMYEPPNRGGKTWAALGRVTGGNDPGSITDPTVLANAFLMPRGYTMVWSGWDKSAGTSTANFNATITLPIAKNPDGSTITGPAYEYIVTGAASFTLSYPAATLDKSQATLTHRVHLNDAPVVIPAPFASTQAERMASGDPRPSVEERYPSFGQYYSEVIRAIDDLVKDRLLLCEDADEQQARLLPAGLDRGVPPPHGHLPPSAQPPLCHAPNRSGR